jgi:hypothetical protein
MLRHTAIIGLVAAAMSVGLRPARAAVYSLTSDSGSPFTINGARFFYQDSGPSGTGILDAFVRIQKAGTEQGYNTSGRGVPFDDKNDPSTHNILLGDVPIVTYSGTRYFEFVLDIAEGGDKCLSLDAIKLYTSTTASQTTVNLSSLGTVRYDFGSNEVLLKGAGSGKVDMTMLVPVWSAANANDYVYLYSAFGGLGNITTGPNKGDWSSSGSFEEWGLLSDGDRAHLSAIPEPTALILWSILGVIGIGIICSHQRRRAAA